MGTLNNMWSSGRSKPIPCLAFCGGEDRGYRFALDTENSAEQPWVSDNQFKDAYASRPQPLQSSLIIITTRNLSERQFVRFSHRRILK